MNKYSQIIYEIFKKDLSKENYLNRTRLEKTVFKSADDIREYYLDGYYIDEVTDYIESIVKLVLDTEIEYDLIYRQLKNEGLLE